MNRDTLIKLHQATCERALDLLKSKNADYAEKSNIFGNLDMIEALDLGTTEGGIVVRMGDKLRRLSAAARRPLAVKDESVADTVMDLINYAILYLAKRETRERNPQPQPPQNPPPSSHLPSVESWPSDVRGKIAEFYAGLDAMVAGTREEPLPSLSFGERLSN